MSFELNSYASLSAADPTLSRRAITLKYSDYDIISLAPEYILQAIVSKMADKFVEDHYAEIEKQIDPKLVAAVVAATMGAAVEKKMMEEVDRVRELANAAMRRAKR
jgi:hypothetical protein